MAVANQYTAVPMPMALWSQVDTTGGADACWLWGGAANDNGYGVLKRKGFGTAPHQAAYILTFGDPRPLYVLHRCDTRLCCNPRHLFTGTQKQNIGDMLAKGRAASAEQRRHLGMAHGRAKLTDNNVRQIRRLAAEGMSLSEITRRFPVSRAMIQFIVSRRNWTHI